MGQHYSQNAAIDELPPGRAKAIAAHVAVQGYLGQV